MSPRQFNELQRQADVIEQHKKYLEQKQNEHEHNWIPTQEYSDSDVFIYEWACSCGKAHRDIIEKNSK